MITTNRVWPAFPTPTLRSFTAELLELESGEVYGACFLNITEKNKNHDLYRARDCRKRCRENAGDLPIIRSAIVQKYMLDEVASGAPYPIVLGATRSRETGNWTWVPDGSEVVFTSWLEGEPNGADFLCVEPCVLLHHKIGRGWVDHDCGAKMGTCVYHVENATRDGATIYVEKKMQKGPGPPFSHKPEALALVIISMVILAFARFAAAEDGSASAKVADASEAGRTENAEVVATIESDEGAEQAKFKRMLDDTTTFPCFRNKEEENLFAVTTCESGVKDVCATLTRTLPSLVLGGSAVCILLFEVIHFTVYRRLTGEFEKEFGSRPFIFATVFASILTFSVGFFAPRRRITAAIFPYFAFGSAILFVIVSFLLTSVLVRYGSLSKMNPWDGQARLIFAMVIIFLPRMTHLTLAFATSLSVLVVLSLELFLQVMYNVYGYNCSCYNIFADSFNNVRTHRLCYPSNLAETQSHPSHPYSCSCPGGDYRRRLDYYFVPHLSHPAHQGALRTQIIPPPS